MSSTPSIIETTKQSLRWLAERQKIVAENILNARTPHYIPNDLKPMKDQKNFGGALKMDTSKGGHISGAPVEFGGSQHFETTPSFDPRDVSPSGNAVVLEQEMVKSADTGQQFKSATATYEALMDMRRKGLGK